MLNLPGSGWEVGDISCGILLLLGKDVLRLFLLSLLTVDRFDTFVCAASVSLHQAFVSLCLPKGPDGSNKKAEHSIAGKQRGRWGWRTERINGRREKKDE